MTLPQGALPRYDIETMEYQSADGLKTLRTALAELRATEGAGDVANQVAQEISNDLDIHDAIHVIFACPTSLEGEVLAHVWTLLGTTARISDLHRVMRHRDHRTVLANIGHGQLLKVWITSLPTLARTAWRAFRMPHRLPVEQLDALLDQALSQIRTDYGIRLSDQSPAGPRAGAGLRNIRGTSLPAA